MALKELLNNNVKVFMGTTINSGSIKITGHVTTLQNLFSSLSSTAAGWQSERKEWSKMEHQLLNKMIVPRHTSEVCFVSL